MEKIIQNEDSDSDEELDNYRLTTDEKYRKEWIDNKVKKNAITYKFNEMKFYLACFDALNNEIYFQDYFTNQIIKKNYLLNNQLKKYQDRINVLQSYWEKIKALTGFGQGSYISNKTKEYFKRPIFSGFLYPETKGIFTDHYHNFIPSVIKNYKECEIEITAHINCFDDELVEYHVKENKDNNIKISDNKDKNIKENKDNNEKDSAELERKKYFNKAYDEFKFTCKVSILYVVNSLIQDSIDELKIFLLKKIKEEKNKLNEEENNEIDEDEEEYNINNNYYNNKRNKQKQSNFSDKYYFLYNQLDIIKQSEKNKEYQFIFKTSNFEEYIYGNNPIGSYQSVYNSIRQYKKVSLILCKLPVFKIEPKLSSFPPIITMKKDEEITYFNLLDKYFEYFSDEFAIFRYGETEINIYEKEEDREKKLTKYCESSNCDCPFQFDIVGIFNFKLLFKWLNHEPYFKLNDEIMLEYFSEFDTKEKYESSLFKNKVKKFFGIKDKKKVFNSNENNNGIAGINEEGIDEAPTSKKLSKEDKKDKKKESKEKHKAKKLLKDSRKNECNLQKVINILKIDSNGEDNKPVNKLFNSSSFPEILEKKINDTNVQYYPLQEQKNTNYYKYIKFNPIFVQLKVEMLYGSYNIKTLYTQNYLISDNVYMMELMTFDPKKLLISYLPKETRLGISVYILNKDSSSKVELGSAQIPVFDQNDEMLSGEIKVNIWPLFQINPRVNCCDEFLYKTNIIRKPKKSILKEKYRNLEKNANKNINPNSKANIRRSVLFMNEDKITTLNDKITSNKNNYNKEDTYEYCYIILKFPKFSSPMIYTEKNQFSDEEFLEIKDSKNANNIKNQLEELFIATDEFKDTISTNDDDEIINKNIEFNKKFNENSFEKNDKLSDNIDNLFQKLKNINRLINIDPLSPISKNDRIDILICRDFLCSDQKALDIFLRAINWFNPLERYLAHTYLKKWAKLEPEDALGLLDARFPDTQVRLLAIQTLSQVTDDFIDLYMLELCQCLFYESHYISPLSDFLISRCLKNKKLLGNKFYWCLKVSEGNILFKDRIKTLLTQLFMMSGPDFIDYIIKIKENNEEFRNISAEAKKIYPQQGKKATINKVKELIIEKFNNGIKEFVLPVHPSYYVYGFGFKELNVYSSKMVPIKLHLYSSEGQSFYVIFKIGDDLRQDLMILQIFRIMDKIWMENNLDLKFSVYNVCPIDLRSGFMECVDALPVEDIQKLIGGGSILQDTLYRYLQNVSYEITGNKKNLQFDKMIDNYIKSLAGYCVATGVLGIADRHPANIMLKKNGLFLHIDFGHIFGNFKKKLGFKRERSVFLLTPQMAYIYVQSNKTKEFVDYCTSAFNILRANAKKFLNIMITMSSSNMPEFSTMSDVTYVKEQLKLNMNEKDASEYFIKTIKDSLNDTYRTIDNLIHNFVHP